MTLIHITQREGKHNIFFCCTVDSIKNSSFLFGKCSEITYKVSDFTPFWIQHVNRKKYNLIPAPLKLYGISECSLTDFVGKFAFHIFFLCDEMSFVKLSWMLVRYKKKFVCKLRERNFEFLQNYERDKLTTC